MAELAIEVLENGGNHWLASSAIGGPPRVNIYSRRDSPYFELFSTSPSNPAVVLKAATPVEVVSQADVPSAYMIGLSDLTARISRGQKADFGDLAGSVDAALLMRGASVPVAVWAKNLSGSVFKR